MRSLIPSVWTGRFPVSGRAGTARRAVGTSQARAALTGPRIIRVALTAGGPPTPAPPSLCSAAPAPACAGSGAGHTGGQAHAAAAPAPGGRGPGGVDWRARTDSGGGKSRIPSSASGSVAAGAHRSAVDARLRVPGGQSGLFQLFPSQWRHAGAPSPARARGTRGGGDPQYPMILRESERAERSAGRP
jgi:hypothetical protein